MDILKIYLINSYVGLDGGKMLTRFPIKPYIPIPWPNLRIWSFGLPPPFFFQESAFKFIDTWIVMRYEFGGSPDQTGGWPEDPWDWYIHLHEWLNFYGKFSKYTSPFKLYGVW